MTAISIKAARITRRMTLEDFAERVGVSVGTVSNWERGRYVPDIVEFVKIMEVLGLEWGELEIPKKKEKM